MEILQRMLEQFPLLPIIGSFVVIIVTTLYFLYKRDEEEDVVEEKDSATEEEEEEHMKEVAFCAEKLKNFDGKFKTPKLLIAHQEMQCSDSMIVNVPNDLEEEENAFLNEMTADDFSIDNNSPEQSDISPEDVADIVDELSDNEDGLQIKELDSDEAMEDEGPSNLVVPSMHTLSKLKQKKYRNQSGKLTAQELEQEKRIQREQLQKVLEVMNANPEMFHSSENDVNQQMSMYTL